MRVAVSDYDGTLKINDSVNSKNIDAIKAWRKGGNLFGIATGRDFSLIMHEVNYWRIPFDFLICVNGAALYDLKLNAVKTINIPDTLIREILLHPASMASMHYQICTNGINKLYIRDENSYFNEKNLPFQEISFEESLLEKDIQQISLAYATNCEYLRRIDELSTVFEDMLSINLNGLFVDINKYGVNKLSGILDLSAIQGWPTKDLLTIGDGENDIPMIRHFKGFSIHHASNRVINEATAVYKSVGEMLINYL